MQPAAESGTWGVCGQDRLCTGQVDIEFTVDEEAVCDEVVHPPSPSLFCGDLPALPSRPVSCNHIASPSGLQAFNRTSSRCSFPSVSIDCKPENASCRSELAPIHFMESASPKASEIDLDFEPIYGLDASIFPGDVLNFVGHRHGLSRLGATGGFMGHVVLVVSVARPLNPFSEVGQAFKTYRMDGPNKLYIVNTVECSRSSSGLSESSLIFYTTTEGRIFACGEVDGNNVFQFDDCEEMHIWLSKKELRTSNFRCDVMQEVLRNMKTKQQNWSWSTAVRAFLLSGNISSGSDASMSLEQIQASWEAEPICSSIVVIFWQMYLHRLAVILHVDPLDMILNHMPLKADRVLPGELLCCLKAQGWTLLQPSALVQQKAKHGHPSANTHLHPWWRMSSSPLQQKVEADELQRTWTGSTDVADERQRISTASTDLDSSSDDGLIIWTVSTDLDSAFGDGPESSWSSPRSSSSADRLEPLFAEVSM